MTRLLVMVCLVGLIVLVAVVVQQRTKPGR